MVLIKNPVKSVILPLAVTSLIFLDGCKEDEIIPKFSTDTLIGIWQLTEQDGYDYTSSDFSIILKFKSSGDMDFCLEAYSYSYCDNQAWKWRDANQSTLIITAGTEEIIFDIVILDATKLEGNITEPQGTDSYEIKFTKVI